MVLRMIIRTYSELSKLKTFEERYNYLRLDGTVCEETFGFDRYINQIFYKSKEWKLIRNFVIVRDKGFDLGVEGYEIHGRILIHHINPISKSDFEKKSDFLLNPEYLITTMHSTHNAIHYGDYNLLNCNLVVRIKNDTCPWKQ